VALSASITGYSTMHALVDLLVNINLRIKLKYLEAKVEYRNLHSAFSCEHCVKKLENYSFSYCKVMNKNPKLKIRGDFGVIWVT